MQVFERKEECSGCTACEHVCPVAAIRMMPDKEGFLYPLIDEAKCIHCGLCRSVCPFHPAYDRESNFDVPIVYAVKHSDETVRQQSTSGGMFTAISDAVLTERGAVYGAVFGQNFEVLHTKAENTSERDRMRGSKYVQSRLGSVFHEIQDELKNGRKILFTGTPCQTVGLKAFLKKRDMPLDNLLLCDLVCLGTPSPLLWCDYVYVLEKQYSKRLKYFDFRDKKSRGWHQSGVAAIFEDNTECPRSHLFLSFEALFNSHLALRPACYHCPFTNTQRTGDITIADFWGIEKHHPHFDDNKGISLVFLNSPKGKRVFNEVKKYITYIPTSAQEATDAQNHLKHPARLPARRADFWRDFMERGYVFIYNRYLRPSFAGRIKHFLKNKVLSIYKHLLKENRQ